MEKRVKGEEEKRLQSTKQGKNGPKKGGFPKYLLHYNLYNTTKKNKN